MQRLTIVLVLSLSFSGIALSKELATCGGSDGYVYFPKSGAMASSDDGGKWLTDKISAGKFTFTRQGDKFDILYVDATGSVTSTTADGGKVIAVGRTKNSLALVVNYSGASVETYMLTNSANGPEVVWTQMKYRSAILKIAAFRAACTSMELD
jgi:hypothetical protein